VTEPYIYSFSVSNSSSTSAGGVSQVSLLYSLQCPQEVKDDIAESDKVVGEAVLNRAMTPAQLSLAKNGYSNCKE